MTPRDTTTGWSIIRQSLLDRRGPLTAGSVLLCVHQMCEVAVPILIGVIVDQAVDGGHLGALALWIGVLAGVFVALTTCYRLGARLGMNAALRQAHQLRMDAVRRILGPRRLRTDLRSGELLAVTGTDADETAALLRYLPQALGALAALAVCAVALLIIDVPLGLTVLFGVPLVLGLLQLSAPLLTRQTLDQQTRIARATGAATDLIAGLRPLRGIGAEDAAAQRYSAASRHALTAMRRTSAGQGAFMGAAIGVSAILAVAVATGAGWFALEGRISIGELITVLGLAQFFLEPLAMLSLLPGKAATARASAQRLALITDAEFAKPAGVSRLGPGPHGVEFRNVEYASLHGLSMIAKPGDCLGVVVTDPVDGTSIIDLLAGSATPHRGDVWVSDIPAAAADLTELPRALLVQPHLTDLFSGSLLHNVTTGAPAAAVSDAAAALRAVAAADLIDSHPEGIDRMISDRGQSLSGGQRQRVALARALAADSSVLVLHDPTTSIDSVTERTVAAELYRRRHEGRSDHTTIVITSSPALLASADRVIFVDGGRVRGEGTHAELASADLRYREAVLR
ncbi:MAG: ABC transporter ATP-binding protein [Gordonia sp.]|nr:ABC transporter ATP-binding protein [Gordonia sp. (in: high G+C Gram-positive bacteria)]